MTKRKSFVSRLLKSNPLRAVGKTILGLPRPGLLIGSYIMVVLLLFGVVYLKARANLSRLTEEMPSAEGEPGVVLEETISESEPAGPISPLFTSPASESSGLVELEPKGTGKEEIQETAGESTEAGQPSAPENENNTLEQEREAAVQEEQTAAVVITPPSPTP
jgi:hypothetical protein